MKDKLARAAIWIAATRVLVNLIGFVSTIALARLLLPSDFGLVAIATTVMAIISSVTEIPLGSALIKHNDPEDAHYDTAFTLSLIRSVVIASFTSAVAWPLATLYGDSRLFDLIVVLAIVSASIGLANPKMVVFWRALVFWQDFLVNVLQKAVGFIAAAVVAYIYQSYWALVVGAALSQLVSLVLSYILVRYRPRFSLAKMRELMSFSLWLSASQIVATLNYRFDNLLIGYFLGKTTVGIYSYADNLAGLATREMTAPVANTLFPAFARLQDDLPRLRKAHAQAQSLLFAIALPTGCGVAMFAYPLVHIALGDKWLPAVFVIKVIAIVLAVQTLGNTYYALALALGHTKRLFQRDVLNFCLRLPIVAAGLWLGGFAGVVLARSVTGTLALLLNLELIRWMLGARIRDQIKANLRPIIATGAMAIVVGALKASFPPSAGWEHELLNLCAQVATAVATYFLATYATWRLAGRPYGVEREFGLLVASLRKRMLG